MKTLLSLCSILLFICTTSSKQDNRVYDSDRNVLQPGSKYYVVLAVSGTGGGGIGLSKYSNVECPDTVTRGPCDHDLGILCSFHPADPHEFYIRHSKSLNIKFETSLPCANSTVWRLGNLDHITRTSVIKIGGVHWNPECETISNWFMIEKGSSVGTYIFVFNPNDVCSYANLSLNLTSAWALGKRPLVLSFNRSGFEVQFVSYAGVHRNKADVQ